jgi:hypothetical protein
MTIALRPAHLCLLLVVALVLIGPGAARAASPVIAAAGDIACDPADPGFNGGAGTADRCQQRATSDLLVGAGLAAVLPLGDIQYVASSIDRINTVYDPTWGRVKSISRPILGNHESTGMGYFDYFNGKGAADGPAGPRGKGYYSFDVGGWHLVALNSNCSAVACSPTSEQASWLRADLAAHPAMCTLAYWHHPRYSSGHEGSSSFMEPLWEILHDADVDVLLSGHSHDYERFAPLSASGDVDPANGIRQFVVGTGGAFFTGGISTRIPGSEVAQNDTFGVLMLTLHPSSYDWRFVPIAGRSFTDSGSTACHGSGPPPPPPAPAGDGTAPVLSGLSVSPRQFRLARRGSGSRGTTFSFALSEPGRVTVTIARRSRGRYRRVGGFARAGVAGANKRWWGGWIRRKKLGPGRFRAGFVATDAAGNRSTKKRVRFRIIRH